MTTQFTTSTFIPKVTGSLSIIGSAYIVQDVIRNIQKRKRSTHTYHRLMLGLSMSDIIVSFCGHVLSSWPLPKDSGNDYAFGSVGTCDVTAFFNTIGIFSATLYNCSLTTLFLLQLKYLWTTKRIERIEKWLHIVPWFTGLSYAIAGLAAKTFGPFNSRCWVTIEYPSGCSQNDAVECIRGDGNTFKYFWYSSLSNRFLAVFYVSITMYMVFAKVQAIEKDAEKYKFASFLQSLEKKKDRKRSRRVMLQGILYSVTLTIVLLVPLVSFVWWKISKRGRSFPLEILYQIFVPIQGLFNLFIYLIPTFRRMLKEHRAKRQAKEEGFTGNEDKPLSTSNTNKNTSIDTKGHGNNESDIVTSNIIEVNTLDNLKMNEYNIVEEEKVEEEKNTNLNFTPSVTERQCYAATRDDAIVWGDDGCIIGNKDGDGDENYNSNDEDEQSGNSCIA